MNSPIHANFGVLLVGHGTREPAGRDEFLELAHQVARSCPQTSSEGCFLELAEPTIAAAVATLYRRGVRSLAAVPLMLFAAGHVKRDIPREVSAAVEMLPGMEFVKLTEHLGCRETMVELAAERFRETRDKDTAVAPQQTILLFVARGSSDAAATEETMRFADLLQQRTGVGRLDSCFLAMADPRFAEHLQALAQGPCRRIVVQPHLLFAGRLLEEVQSAVAEMGARHPEKRWDVTRHIGPCRELVAEIREIVTSSLPDTILP